MRIRTLAAVLLSVFSGTVSFSAAHAAALDSRMTIIGFTYRLVDLAPDDGITPWLRFDPDSQVVLSTQDDASWAGSSALISGGVLNGTPGQMVSSDGSLQAIYSPSQMSTSVSMTEQDLQTGFQSRSSTIQHQPSLAGDFTLSANTGLVIEALVSVQNSINLPDSLDIGSPQASKRLSVNVWSNVVAQIFYRDDETRLSAPYEFSGVYDNYAMFANSESFDSDFDTSGALAGDPGQTLVIGVANGTSTDASFSFSFDAATDVYSNLYTRGPTSNPPIPEPSTWALMGLGLLGVAATTRRQARLASH